MKVRIIIIYILYDILPLFVLMYLIYKNMSSTMSIMIFHQIYKIVGTEPYII